MKVYGVILVIAILSTLATPYSLIYSLDYNDRGYRLSNTNLTLVEYFRFNGITYYTLPDIDMDGLMEAFISIGNGYGIFYTEDYSLKIVSELTGYSIVDAFLINNTDNLVLLMLDQDYRTYIASIDIRNSLCKWTSSVDNIEWFDITIHSLYYIDNIVYLYLRTVYGENLLYGFNIFNGDKVYEDIIDPSQYIITNVHELLYREKNTVLFSSTDTLVNTTVHDGLIVVEVRNQYRVVNITVNGELLYLRGHVIDGLDNKIYLVLSRVVNGFTDILVYYIDLSNGSYIEHNVTSDLFSLLGSFTNCNIAYDTLSMVYIVLNIFVDLGNGSMVDTLMEYSLVDFSYRTPLLLTNALILCTPIGDFDNDDVLDYIYTLLFYEIPSNRVYYLLSSIGSGVLKEYSGNVYIVLNPYTRTGLIDDSMFIYLNKYGVNGLFETALCRITYVFDNTPPEVYVYKPIANGVYDRVVDVEFTVFDNESSIILVNLTIYGPETVERLYHGVEGDFSIHVTFNISGIYTLYLSVVNEYGLEYSIEPIEFIVDCDYPLVDIRSPTNNSFVKNTMNLVFYVNDTFYPLDLIIDVNDTIVFSGKVSKSLQNIVVDLTGFDDGVLEVNVSAIDTIGHAGYDVVYVVKDTVPPVITIYKPSNGSTVEGVMEVSCSVFDKNLDHTEVYVDEELWFTTTNASIYSVYDTRMLTNGEHILLFKAFDKAGNIELEKVLFIVSNPVIEPEVSISGLTNNSVVHNTLSISLSLVSITLARIYVNDTLLVEYSEPIDTTITVDTRELGDGEHRLVVEAYGSGGAFKKIIYLFIVDNKPPVINVELPPLVNEFIDPGSIEFGVFGEKNISVSVSVYDATFDHLEVYVNGSLKDVYYEGNVSFEIGFVDDGFYSLELRAYDKAGHSSGLEKVFGIDTSPPELTITPSNNTILAGKRVVIEYSINDLSGFSEGYYRIRYGEAWSNRYDITNAHGSIEVLLSPDTPYIEFVLSDKLGNSRRYLVKYSIDLEDPGVNLYVSVSGKDVFIQAIASDNYGVDYVEILIDNKLFKRAYGNNITTVTKLPIGKHVITAIAVDLAGRKSSVDKQVYIAGEVTTTPTTASTTNTTTTLPSEAPLTTWYAIIAVIIIPPVIAAITLLYLWRRKRG